MGDLTQDRPKCMIELARRPLLSYQLHALTAAGISQIAIVCGYKGEKILVGTKRTWSRRWPVPETGSKLRLSS
jgi:NDP-sugar pyrophosphorylase family protein